MWKELEWGAEIRNRRMRFIDLRFIFIGRHAEINEPSMAAGQKGDPERVCGLNGVCVDGSRANKWIELGIHEKLSDPCPQDDESFPMLQ